MTHVFVVWVGVMAGLLATPRGRATLARWLADTRRVLGFDRGDVGRRWHELAAAEDAADPALRRCAAVKDAYLAGEFGPDELDWRILLAFQPPVPRDREYAHLERSYADAARLGLVIGGSGTLCATASPSSAIPWTATDGRNPWRRVSPGEHCAFHELQSGSGYVGTFCDCGHDMNQHYNGGCNDCNAFHRGMEPLPTEPDPRLGEHLGHRPPKPSDSARSVRLASRQSHG